ncbi:hypothetical protein KEJ27_00745 [Candidatus Bathyarchaeota archaeon]|nr:hypothetical protein [Candidatus Bathyarchaeota archaeon]MBS7617042.1 hypothetical protein [Candidatus Bathyarchaeota archaeon]
MGRRRRRKVIRTFRRTIPKVYTCPQCGKRTVTVQMIKEANIAHVACGTCKISGDITLSEGMTAVDAYCTWYDEAISGKRLEELKQGNLGEG